MARENVQGRYKMSKELELQDAFIDALYDHLTYSELKSMLREEFHKEYHEYGPVIAVYNLGFLTGGGE